MWEWRNRNAQKISIFKGESILFKFGSFELIERQSHFWAFSKRAEGILPQNFVSSQSSFRFSSACFSFIQIFSNFSNFFLWRGIGDFTEKFFPFPLFKSGQILRGCKICSDSLTWISAARILIRDFVSGGLMKENFWENTLILKEQFQKNGRSQKKKRVKNKNCECLELRETQCKYFASVDSFDFEVFDFYLRFSNWIAFFPFLLWNDSK